MTLLVKLTNLENGLQCQNGLRCPTFGHFWATGRKRVVLGHTLNTQTLFTMGWTPLEIMALRIIFSKFDNCTKNVREYYC